MPSYFCGRRKECFKLILCIIGYYIPEGFMFEYISGANLFGESLEWFGFAVASACVFSWAFSFNTFVVLGTRAVQHHRWYLKKFEDYPKQRKAFIPFIL